MAAGPPEADPGDAPPAPLLPTTDHTSLFIPPPLHTSGVVAHAANSSDCFDKLAGSIIALTCPDPAAERGGFGGRAGSPPPPGPAEGLTDRGLSGTFLRRM